MSYDIGGIFTRKYTGKEFETAFSQLVKDLAVYQSAPQNHVSVPLEQYPGFTIDVEKHYYDRYSSPYIKVTVIFDKQYRIAVDYSENISGTQKEKEQIVRDCLQKTLNKFEDIYQAYRKGDITPHLPGGGLEGQIKAAEAKQALLVYFQKENGIQRQNKVLDSFEYEER